MLIKLDEHVKITMSVWSICQMFCWWLEGKTRIACLPENSTNLHICEHRLNTQWDLASIERNLRMGEICWADAWSIYDLTATNSKTDSYQRCALGIVRYIPQSYGNTHNFYNTSVDDKIKL